MAALVLCTDLIPSLTNRTCEAINSEAPVLSLLLPAAADFISVHFEQAHSAFHEPAQTWSDQARCRHSRGTSIYLQEPRTNTDLSLFILLCPLHTLT